MTNLQIIQTALDLGVPANVIQVFKDEYRCWSPDEIQGKLAQVVLRFVVDNQLMGGESFFNCVNYVDTVVFISRLEWIKSADPLGLQYPVATGSAGFSALGHALFINADYGPNEQPRLLAFEAVPRQDNALAPTRLLFPVELTREQWQSCLTLRFP